MEQESDDHRPLLTEIQVAWGNALKKLGPCVRVGPFLALVHPKSEQIWLNYAVPTRPLKEGESLEEALGRVAVLFDKNKRRLRFELISDLWPDLVETLDRHRMVRQCSVPLMICTREDLNQMATPSGAVTLEHLSGDAPDSHLLRVLRLRNEGFGSPSEPEQHEVAEYREQLRTGALRSAIAWLDGELAGVASMTAGGAVSELAGVTTKPSLRNRGVARAVSRFLTADHLNKGGKAVWLSAGDDTARRVYERCGFRIIGTQVNYVARED